MKWCSNLATTLARHRRRSASELRVRRFAILYPTSPSNSGNPIESPTEHIRGAVEFGTHGGSLLQARRLVKLDLGDDFELAVACQWLHQRAIGMCSLLRTPVGHHQGSEMIVWP